MSWALSWTASGTIRPSIKAWDSLHTILYVKVVPFSVVVAVQSSVKHTPRARSNPPCHWGRDWVKAVRVDGSILLISVRASFWLKR